MFFIGPYYEKGSSSHLFRASYGSEHTLVSVMTYESPFPNKLDQTVIVCVSYIYINIVCFFHINRGIFTLISDFHEETSPC